MFAFSTRRNSHRAISFDALEDRMVLSAGAIELPHAPVHVEKIHAEAKAAPPVTGTLKGDIQLHASEVLVFTNVRGNLGKPKLTGTGVGIIEKNHFDGGKLQLSGANGTLTFDLNVAPIKNATGSNPSFKSEAEITSTTGSYAGNDGAVLGSAGTVTVSWNQHKVKSAGIPAAKGDRVYIVTFTYNSLKIFLKLDSFDSLAYFLLNY